MKPEFNFVNSQIINEITRCFIKREICINFCKWKKILHKLNKKRYLTGVTPHAVAALQTIDPLSFRVYYAASLNGGFYSFNSISAIKPMHLFCIIFIIFKTI